MKIKIGERADGSYIVKVNGVMRTICRSLDLRTEVKKLLKEYLTDSRSTELDFETDGFSSDEIDKLVAQCRNKKLLQKKRELVK